MPSKNLIQPKIIQHLLLKDNVEISSVLKWNSYTCLQWYGSFYLFLYKRCHVRVDLLMTNRCSFYKCLYFVTQSIFLSTCLYWTMASFLFNTSNSCLRKHQRIHTFSHAELCVTSRAAHGCANINNEVARGGVTRTWFAPLGHNVLDVSALNPN
jgi:hypothetical protein